MDLLVSYSWGQLYRAKPEIIRTLKRFGDPDPRVEKTPVMGIAIAHTNLDNREVIGRCWALWRERPLDSFEAAIKWVPVDYWCESELDAIKRLIDTHIKDHITQDQTWRLRVRKRRWQRYHTTDIVEYLAADITRKVDLTRPDWTIWVDVLGPRTAVSLLKPGEIFSLGLPHP